MKCSLQSTLRLFSVIGAIVCTAAVTAADMPPLAPIPASLQPASGQLLSLTLQAKGVQIYRCKVNKDDATRFDWIFVSPEADLLDSAGQTVAKHYAGPTWESTDGSRVVGELKAHEDSPDPHAIPWLLLTAKSTSGTGIFSSIQSIQRVATSGGKALDTGCSSPHEGEISRVPYTAEYRFFKSAP